MSWGGWDGGISRYRSYVYGEECVYVRADVDQSDQMWTSTRAIICTENNTAQEQQHDARCNRWRSAGARDT